MKPTIETTNNDTYEKILQGKLGHLLNYSNTYLLTNIAIS